MSWRTSERATVFGGIIVAGLCVAVYLVFTGALWDFSTLRSRDGLPLAADFANYWSASRLALSGQAALAYNINDLHEVQQQVFGTHHYQGAGWYYPPTFLLLVLPLGLMPYLPAFFVWIGVTLILYLIVLSRLSSHPIVLPLGLLFTGTFENFLFGQNGFLSGALLGGGLLLLDRSPLVAGILFGFLCYKPPLVILVFAALILGRYWKTLAGALVTILILSGISLMAFSYQVWLDYFKVMGIPVKLLEIGVANWSIMPTFFAATLSAGFGVKAAYLVQGVVMLVVAVGVAWVWRRQSAMAIRGSVLVLGTLLFTPYAFLYDLALLALPLAWLWEEGRLHGRLPGELILLLVGWLMPLMGQIWWNHLNIFQGKLQIDPLILLMLFILALVKAKAAITRNGA